jgi:hypothetical protein
MVLRLLHILLHRVHRFELRAVVAEDRRRDDDDGAEQYRQAEASSTVAEVVQAIRVVQMVSVVVAMVLHR